MNFNARVEHLIGGTNQLQPEYPRRQNDRSNLGVGDFDLPERAFATDNSTDTFRAALHNVIGKKVFSEFRFSLIDSTLSTTSTSQQPTVRVNDAFTTGGAGQMGDRHAREIELAQNFDFTIGRKHSMRAGAAVRIRLVGQRSALERVRHLHLHEHRRLQRRTAGDVFDPHRRSAGRVLADQGRLVPPGRFPSGPDAAAQRRPAPGNPDPGRFEVEPRAARGVHVERDQEDDGAGRLRDFLRLVRLRRSTSRRFASTASTRST